MWGVHRSPLGLTPTTRRSSQNLTKPPGQERCGHAQQPSRAESRGLMRSLSPFCSIQKINLSLCLSLPFCKSRLQIPLSQGHCRPSPHPGQASTVPAGGPPSPPRQASALPGCEEDSRRWRRASPFSISPEAPVAAFGPGTCHLLPRQDHYQVRRAPAPKQPRQ